MIPAYLAPEFKLFQGMVVDAFKLLPNWMNELSPENLSDHQFHPIIEQLTSIYGNTLTPNVNIGIFGLNRILKKIEVLYIRYNQSDLSKQLLIPGYIDFSIPFNKDYA